MSDPSLDIVPGSREPHSAPHSSEDKILAVVAHLGYFSGVGYIIAPLIIWLMKKDKSPFVAHHAKQALAWQLGSAAFGAILFFVGFALTAATAGLVALLFIPLWGLLGLALLIPSILAAVAVSNDKQYLYPVTGEIAEKL